MEYGAMKMVSPEPEGFAAMSRWSAQRHHRKSSEEKVASWRDASADVMPSTYISLETDATPDRGRDLSIWYPGVALVTRATPG